MQNVLEHKDVKRPDGVDNLFIVLCASGFENPARVRSALMFASLAAAADYRTILYCIQNAVDVMVNGVLEKQEKAEPGCRRSRNGFMRRSISGVEIQCCTQTMANKNIKPEDLIPGVTPAGAMSLIDLASHAKGSLCF